MLNTEYKEIKGFYGQYTIHRNGELYSLDKKRKTFINNSGYECIILNLDRRRFHFLIHRLVAEYFIPNPDNKPEVNHIDGNKLNNDACNLEWVTSSENKQHARKNGLSVYNRPSLGIKLSEDSKYHNVSYDNNRSKWRASVRHNGKTYFQKRFDTEEEAALHVNWILDELNLDDRPRNVVQS